MIIVLQVEQCFAGTVAQLELLLLSLMLPSFCFIRNPGSSVVYQRTLFPATYPSFRGVLQYRQFSTMDDHLKVVILLLQLVF
jgi:hypothetical protein